MGLCKTRRNTKGQAGDHPRAAGQRGRCTLNAHPGPSGAGDVTAVHLKVAASVDEDPIVVRHGPGQGRVRARIGGRGRGRGRGRTGQQEWMCGGQVMQAAISRPQLVSCCSHTGLLLRPGLSCVHKQAKPHLDAWRRVRPRRTTPLTAQSTTDW